MDLNNCEPLKDDRGVGTETESAGHPLRSEGRGEETRERTRKGERPSGVKNYEEKRRRGQGPAQPNL